MAGQQTGGKIGFWLLVASLWLLAACSRVPPPVSEALLAQVATQLPDGATLLLPSAAEATIKTVNLAAVGEAELRPLLQEVVSLYLLIEPDRLALYEETAVSNITWVQNHSELVELTQYEDGHVLYWVVVTQGRIFNTHPLREAPGG